jgi:non-ribosomal peptide synthase protein (TIGR01720 family)
MGGSDTVRGLAGLRPIARFAFTDWSAAFRDQPPVGNGIEFFGPALGRAPLDMRARIIKGSLEVQFLFDERVYQASDADDLAAGFERELRLVIEHCSSAGNSGYTPSDFPFARLDERNLNKLAFLIDKSDTT